MRVSMSFLSTMELVYIYAFIVYIVLCMSYISVVSVYIYMFIGCVVLVMNK